MLLKQIQNKIDTNIFIDVYTQLCKNDTTIKLHVDNYADMYLEIKANDRILYRLSKNAPEEIALRFFSKEFFETRFFLEWHEAAEKIGVLIFDYLLFIYLKSFPVNTTRVFFDEGDE